MASRKYRVEIWNRQNTARVAIFTHTSSAVVHEVLKVQATLAITLPLADQAVPLLVRGSVLRLQEVGASSFTLWRLSDRQRIRENDNSLSVQINAVALWADFAEGTVRQLQAAGHRAAHTFDLSGVAPGDVLADYLIASYEGNGIAFQAGIVEEGIVASYNPSFDKTTPLAGLRSLEELCSCEALFRLDETGAFYYIDLLQRIGASAGTPELRYRKNLTGISRLEAEQDVVTRLRSYGSGDLSLADARWTVASVAGSDVTFTSDPSPVFEDDAFVGLWFVVEGKGTFEITDSVAGGAITVSIPTGLAAGDVGYFSMPVLGAGPIDYLESPSGVADYGVRVDTLTVDDAPDAFNIVPNADLSEWNAGFPVGWQPNLDANLDTPTIVQSTDAQYSRIGGSSAHVTAAASGGGITNLFELDLPVDPDRPYTGIYAALTVISGAVRVFLADYGLAAYGGGPTKYPLQNEVTSVSAGTYVELRADPVHAEPLPAGTVRIFVIAYGGPAEFYLDAAMITPQVGSDSPPFCKGSGTEQLWQETAAELARRRIPKVEYQINVADLHEIDPDVFRYEQINLGDDVKVRDPDIGIETMRIVEVTRDLLVAGDTSLVVAESPATRIPSPFWPDAAGRRAVGLSTSVVRPTAALLQHYARYDRTDGLVHIYGLGNSGSATLQLFTKETVDDDWDDTPVQTIDAREGVFDGVPITGEDLYYRILPLNGAAVAGTPLDDVFRGVLVVTGISISFSATNTIVVTSHADRAAVNLYVNAGVDSAPATPTASVHHGVISGSSGTVDTGIVCAKRHLAIVRVVAEDAASQLGTMRQAELRNAAPYLIPAVAVDATYSGTTGICGVTIKDGDLRLYGVTFDKMTDATGYGGSWLSSWDASTGTIASSTTVIRSEAVTRIAGQNAAIKVRVQYYDPDGTLQETIYIVPFSPLSAARVTGMVVTSFDSAGHPTIAMFGNDSTANMYFTAAQDGDPGTPTTSSNHISGDNGKLTLSGLTIDVGHEVWLKGISADGSGNTGVVFGPIPFERTPSGWIVPTYWINPSQSGGAGSFDVYIADPDKRISGEPEFIKKVDAGDYGGSWLTSWDASTNIAGIDTSMIRTEGVTLIEGHNVSVKFRAPYLRPDGTTDYIGDAHSFDGNAIANVTSASCGFNSSIEAKITTQCDEDTDAGAYVTVGDGTTPSDPTSISNHGTVSGSGNGTVQTSVAVTPGNDAIYKVVAYSSITGPGPVRTFRQVAPFPTPITINIFTAVVTGNNLTLGCARDALTWNVTAPSGYTVEIVTTVTPEGQDPPYDTSISPSSGLALSGSMNIDIVGYVKSGGTDVPTTVSHMCNVYNASSTLVASRPAEPVVRPLSPTA